jgi:Domain of unknown function (DUF1929)
MARAFVRVAVAVALLAATAPARAHDLAEAELRSVETAQLGAEHAAAHAAQRRLARAAQAAGARTAPAPLPPVPTQTGGAWAPAARLPVIAINAALLPTGKVLIFAYPGRPGEPGSGFENRAEAYVGYPDDPRSWRRVDPPIDPRTGKPTDIWCGGTSLLADGRVLVTGGNLDDDPAHVSTGLNTVFTFDPWTESWESHERMRQGRWYPTQVLMPDGRTLIASGLSAPGDPDFGSLGPSGSGGMDDDAEVFEPGGDISQLDFRFNDPGRLPLSEIYPKLFWAHTGHVLAAGPRPSDSWYLDPGTPSAWSELPDLSRTRDWGTAVMLADGRVLTLGGSPPDEFVDEDGDGADDFNYRPATATTEIFDGHAGWAAGPDMGIARSHANSVLLPDGTVATLGGGFGQDGSRYYYNWLYEEEQRRVELLDPRTGATILGAAQAEARTYHSTALLLPDARVMSAGDDINGAAGPGSGITDDTVEIYSPPYLFAEDGSPLGPDERPRIASAPTTAQLGDVIEVAASGVPATRAVLVAPGAATHATDMSQRIVELPDSIAVPGGGLRLRVPADANVVLPGYYMLFLLSADGVPSVARFIRVVAPPPAGLGPPAVPAPAASPPPRGAKAQLKVTGRLPSLRALRRSRRFSVIVTLSAPGRAQLRALLERPGRRALAITSTRRIRFHAAGRRRVTFKLTRRGRRLLQQRRRAVVRIRASAWLDSGEPALRVSVRRKLR